MPTKGNSLLFIPDITGFSEFVNEVTLDQSELIIGELLQTIVDANELGMTVSEIEGDAVMFYLEGKVPSQDALIAQAQKMFIAFHRQLGKYKSQQICDLDAYASASKLSLKFIAHAGKLGFVNVIGKKKPHGADMILVHRLLKNKVEERDYLLMTQDVMEQAKCKPLPAWVEFSEGKESFESVGEVNYQYTSLMHLKGLVGDPPPKFRKDLTPNPVVLETEINLGPKELFEIVSDFKVRMNWQVGIERLDYNPGEINHVGTVHQCLVSGMTLKLTTLTHDYGEDKLVYGETTTDNPLASEMTTYFILEPSKTGSKVRLEAHIIPAKGWKRMLIPILRNVLKRGLRKSLESLRTYAEAA